MGEKYGVKPLGHIPGAVLNRYLTDFAKHYGIYERMQFNSTVSLVECTEAGWTLTVTDENGEKKVDTAKLILATGLTSTPNMPHYAGSEKFDRPLFHAKDFCRRADELKGARNVVVVGGAKSAYDVAYAMVESGATVDLVIRPDIMGNDVLQQNQYDDHPELAKLKPWHSVFWIGSGLSILNYSTSFFDMIRDGKVKVHLQNIASLSPGRVFLENGDILQADGMVCSTGWKKESTIRFAGLDKTGLGLPIDAKEQANLSLEYDSKVLDQFPILEKQPVLRSKPKKAAEPLRYYRFMVPSAMVEKRNFAFAGMISTVSTAICASTQGLWITAFFDGKLEREAKTQEEITREVMLHTQWGKWRYPCGYGASLPDFVFEGIPYVDMLLKDLGIKNKRKPSLIQELISPYTPKDYDGVLEEYKCKAQ
ncbi:hypothetical protein SLS59_005325 [Nothophoma quercina]|uniref:Uncharacterized protein n=1 Tax=Nothophoma quercina TaxID=749835 RepID=A0ABR3RA83_9PLEO